jgi:hypothetical protein
MEMKEENIEWLSCMTVGPGVGDRDFFFAPTN